MQGFFLGLANGTSCLAQCAPILIPYFLSAGGNAHKNLGPCSSFWAAGCWATCSLPCWPGL